MHRGRSRDRGSNSSSSQRKPTRSVRSRDRSKNRIQASQSEGNDSTVLQNNDCDELPEVGETQEIEYKRSEMPETPGGLKVVESTIISERVIARKRKRPMSAAPVQRSPQNKHENLQPPALGLPAVWRPLRDDLVKYMQKLHEQTLRILSAKIDQLVDENKE